MEKKMKFLVENTNKTLPQIYTELGLTQKIGWNMYKKLFSPQQRDERHRRMLSIGKLGIRNPMSGKSREQHHNFVGEVSDGKGYVMVLKPDWYSGRKGSKHVFKHHVVMCEAMGLTEIPKGFCVHHIDKDRTNNNLNNLAMLTAGAHTRLHSLEGATTIRNRSREITSSRSAQQPSS